MNKAIVLGATGGIGFALTQELMERKFEVTAFARGEEKLNQLHKGKVKVTAGDALIETDVMSAAEDVDVIFHAVSFPYEQWSLKHPACLETVIKVAKKQKAKVVLIDNIYAYGKQPKKVSEDVIKNPHTKKGKIRFNMEANLKASGVPYLIVHLPDFYGPQAKNTILFETLKNVANNKTANFVGPMNIAREFIYTKDAARVIIELALRDDTYNENWNVSAIHPITGEDLIRTIRELTGYNKKVRTISKTLISFIGLFQPFMREVVEMMYLTEDPVVLSDEKLRRKLGEVPLTPYCEGLTETLKWIKAEGREMSK